MNIFAMEAANLYCGDHQPNRSNHLTLQSLKLPTLEENFADHAAGGAAVAIEIDTHLNRLECTFNLLGWDPDVMVMIGESRRAHQVFTAYGLIREKRNGKALRAMAVMQGRLGRVDPSEFRRGDNMSHGFAIRGITHYELRMQQTSGVNQEIYYWDFFTSERRVGGVNLNAEANTILSIPFAGSGGRAAAEV